MSVGNGIRRQSINAVLSLWRHYRYFGWRGLLYAPLPYFFPSWRYRIVRVPLYGGNVEIRLGTSDVEVFGQVVYAKAYDLPLAFRPETIVDGGANIGLTSIYFARLYPDAEIFAVEPDPENFNLLVRNIADHPRITAIEAAIDGSGRYLTLVRSANGPWAHSVSASDTLSDRGIRVRGVSVNQILDEAGWASLDLLKLDVEGSEIEIFTTAEHWIPKVKVIAIELHDRIRPGCSRAFYDATASFEDACNRGELTVVAQTRSLLAAGAYSP